MRKYFCGWYFRQQSDRQTLAVIPSIHKTKESNFCAVQLITDDQTFYLTFPFSKFHKAGKQIQIGDNQFSRNGLTLNLHAANLDAVGTLQFLDPTPIQYDIMGPFRYVPFLQCRHSVYSMRHSVNGEITINGIPYRFCNDTGYAEGDRGFAFPEKYAWMQCSFTDGAMMLSVADIPFGAFHFTGIIGIVLHHGKEYRLATYLGAKPATISPKQIAVTQGRYQLEIFPKEVTGQPLRAPKDGNMIRTIHEHPSCAVAIRFTRGDEVLLDLDVPNAAFEYEY